MCGLRAFVAFDFLELLWGARTTMDSVSTPGVGAEWDTLPILPPALVEADDFLVDPTLARWGATTESVAVIVGRLTRVSVDCCLRRCTIVGDFAERTGALRSMTCASVRPSGRLERSLVGASLGCLLAWTRAVRFPPPRFAVNGAAVGVPIVVGSATPVLAARLSALALIMG